MKYTNIPTLHFFPNKMYVHLNMFSALMVNWVAQQINNTNIIIINKSGRRNGKMKLKKYVTKLASLKNNISHTTTFSLSTGLRNRRLALSRPRDQILTEKNTIARSRTTGVRTTAPISIGVR